MKANLACALAILAAVGGTPAAVRPQTLSFTDVTLAAGFDYTHGYLPFNRSPCTRLAAGGVAAGDYDGDGFIDLYVIRGGIGPNLLFRNRGDGSFEEVGGFARVGLDKTIGCGPVFGDYDGDGWLDLFVGGIAGTLPTLFRNLGDGTFEDVTAASGIDLTVDTFSASFGDYNLDGYIDLFTTHWHVDHGPTHLWRNNGDGTFVNVDREAGLEQIGPLLFDYSLSANFVDIDNDGWPDLLITGDFGSSRVFRNQRDGTFRDATTPVITDDNGMGSAVGDYDNDGDLDWFVSSIWENLDPGPTGNRLYRNNGNGGFEDVTDQAGVRVGDWGWASSFADFDNDGHLDIYEVNGWPTLTNTHQEDPSRLFMATGNQKFVERAKELGAASRRQGRGLVCFDYDRDGDIDIFIANNSQSPVLLRNDGGNSKNFLGIKLRAPHPNTEGLGARVYARTGATTQMREMRAGSNYVSQDPCEAHFGLGDALFVDNLRIEWPDGETTVLSHIDANQFLVIEHPSLATKQTRSSTPRIIGVSPNPFAGQTSILVETPIGVSTSVTIYDARGRLVREFEITDASGPQTVLTWSGRNNRGVRVASGLYFARVESAPGSPSRKILFVK